ncbi:MAG: VCBS repeat-containing protein [Planctomycetota bacterium]
MQQLSSIAALTVLAAAPGAEGEILDVQTINELEGGLGFVLDDDDRFGEDVDRVGDLDGDGLVDLIVGAPGDDDDGPDAGAAYLLFLDAQGAVKHRTKLTPPNAPTQSVEYGRAVAQVGDLDLDGTVDVAVAREGVIELVSLTPTGGWSFWGRLGDDDYPGAALTFNDFGASLGRLGDLDFDGYEELAVGEPRLDLGGMNRGAVHVFELEDPMHPFPLLSTIGSGSGGFLGSLSNSDEFGTALASPGDVDGDGVDDLVVSAPRDDDGGTNTGALWVLFMNTDGTVASERKISAAGGAPAHLFDDASSFGDDLARLGDFDGAGAPDLLVGGEHLHLLFLRTNGTVRSYLKHDELDVLGTVDGWESVCAVADHDGDGLAEIVVGAPDDETTGPDRGEVHVLFHAEVSPASLGSYGCDLAPDGSLEVTGGPFLGGSFDFLVDNPLGTQNPGALPFVALSLVDLATPCGVQVPGFAMDPSQPAGELLVLDLVVPELIGAPWGGPGQPAAVPVAIPQDPTLLALPLYAQGLLLDPTGGSSGQLLFGLTRGLELTIGS